MATREMRDTLRSLSEEQLDALFYDPSQHDRLRRFFGRHNFEDILELRRQAKSTEARRRRRDLKHTVLVLPGIMGSELSARRNGTYDKIWVDVWNLFFRGRIMDISPEQDRDRVCPSGVLTEFYLKLKVGLEKEGFHAEFHPFDWRLSLEESGARLSEKIAELAKARGGPVSLACHSMGGLVARYATAPGMAGHDHVHRVVQIGTPNHGAFAPVGVFRGTHDLSRKLARFDLFTSMDEYLEKMFLPMRGLYDMLPEPVDGETDDFFHPDSWPDDRARPYPDLLARSRALRDTLFKGDERFRLIAGVYSKDRTTVSGKTDQGVLTYKASFSGDGTVPLHSCLLPGVPTFYVDAEHGALPNILSVIDATADLIKTGHTDELPSTWIPPEGDSETTVSETELRRSMERRRAMDLRRSRRGPTDREAAELLRDFVWLGDGELPEDGEPLSDDPPTLDSDWDGEEHPPIQGRPDSFILVAPGAKRRLNVHIVCGNLVNVRAPMIALGHFENVRPTAAMRAFDRLMGGQLVKRVTSRRIDGTLGRTTQFYARKWGTFADHIVLAGLGAFDRFSADAVEIVAETLIAEAAAQRVAEIGTVALGIGTGLDVEDAVRALFRGFLNGLNEQDPEQVVSTITICDYTRQNCDEIIASIQGLAVGGLLDGLELSVTQSTVPRRPLLLAPDAPPPELALTPVYLQIRGTIDHATEMFHTEASVWKAGGGAAIQRGLGQIELKELRALLSLLNPDKIETIRDQFQSFGNILSESLLGDLGPYLVETLENEQRPLVIMLDHAAAVIPWETLHVGNRAPATERPVSRLYQSLSAVAKPSTLAQQDNLFRVLLIVDPLDDLPGADEEGRHMGAVLSRMTDVEVTVLWKHEATREAVAGAFNSGRFDVAHYAGHGFFDPARPADSGLMLADGNFSGRDAQRLRAIPNVLFFNACEMARIKGDGRRVADRPDRRADQQIRESVGVAEAFLLAGATHFISTYWPVLDTAALAFSTAFYGALQEQETVGMAVKQGRLAARQRDDRDWADYIHYGDPNQTLKLVVPDP